MIIKNINTDYILIIIVWAMVLVGAVILFVSGENFDSVPVDFALNETSTTRSYNLTATAAEEFTTYSQYAAPAEGYEVERIYFVFDNTSESSINIGSLDFSCYADDIMCENWVFGNEEDAFPIGTECKSGETVEGWIYFTVPSDFQKCIIEFLNTTKFVIGGN
jgi:hypothetical protein